MCCLCFRDLNAAFSFMTILVKSLCIHYFNLLCYSPFPLPRTCILDLCEVCWQIVFAQGLLNAFPPASIQAVQCEEGSICPVVVVPSKDAVQIIESFLIYSLVCVEGA